MAKKLKKKENLSKQFRKITLDLSDKAKEALAQRSIPKRGEGVHNARVKRRTKIRKQVLEKQRAMGKVAGVVAKMEKKIRNWPRFSDRFAILQKGISNVYSRGRDEMELALADPSVENLHIWRKSAKYLRYQLEILEQLWIPIVGEMAKQAKALSDTLGLDHDLAVLEELLEGELKEVAGPVEHELFTALIRQRRVELLEEAKQIGPRLYAETPKQFSQRLNGYWKTWLSGDSQKAA